MARKPRRLRSEREVPKPASPLPDRLDFIYDLQKQTWAKLKETDSKAQAIIVTNAALSARLSNLQTEIQSLEKTVRTAVSLILRLLDDPEAQHHAAAVAKEFGTSGLAMNKPTPH